MRVTEPVAVRPNRLMRPLRWEAPGGTARKVSALALRLGCAALLAWIGYIHLHLWQEGYHNIPTDGPMFLIDAVAGFVFCVALLAWPHWLTGLLAAGYTAATLGALFISLWVGLFGFKESLAASYVKESIVIEAVTVLALLTWTGLVVWRRAVSQSAEAPGAARGKHVQR
ncbi:MAG TPA: hypothetical protein VGS19_22125 [Streptosporangiaceae bacterium]|nr:hypothetical protein [Streptosporangiaceae bacterium]